jgi:hypothetical protein
MLDVVRRLVFRGLNLLKLRRDAHRMQARNPSDGPGLRVGYRGTLHCWGHLWAPLRSAPPEPATQRHLLADGFGRLFRLGHSAPLPRLGRVLRRERPLRPLLLQRRLPHDVAGEQRAPGV